MVNAGSIPSGSSYKAGYSFYGGPAADSLLHAADQRFAKVISYTVSWFDFISRWLVQLLNFLDRILGNYGLAIIAVTILIKSLTHPLNRKSFISMQKMQKLAPQLKELQKKYGGDKMRVQQEMARLYKENGVNMAGGCLPMFLQLPIFFALYGAFSQGFSIRHASFIPGWINDLSQPDSVHDLGWTVPVLNFQHISLLPVIYLALQIVQMGMQPKSTDPQQAQQQKMMKFMPVAFFFFFYAMPAGLVLYFTVSSLYGVAESWWLRKVLMPRLGLADDSAGKAEAAAGVKSGAGIIAAVDKRKKRR